DVADASQPALRIAKEAVAGSGHGYQHDIVLVLPHDVVALGIQYADHGKGHIINAHHLPYRVHAAIQLLGHRAADDGDLGGGPDFRRLENASVIQRPLTRHKEFR